MTGKDGARVLDAGRPFPQGFEEVSENAHHVHKGCNDKAVPEREGEKPRPIKDEANSRGTTLIDCWKQSLNVPLSLASGSFSSLDEYLAAAHEQLSEYG